jgi:LIVCS family branched-chain amino acid:cation transporter
MNQSMGTKELLSLSLAIFCMLFGAGNLLYPLSVGKSAGSLTAFGMIGFFFTAILLPLTGLVGMILFDGNYNLFFNRLGKKTGSFLIFVCMLIIGPVIVIPRCITLSHTMIAPFIPIIFLQTINLYSSLTFCLLFLSAAFITTYRASKIVTILGDVIAPILLASIAFIIGKGIYSAQEPVATTLAPFTIFKTGFMMGYQTLDLLGTLFFASIIITILKKTTHKKDNLHALALNGLKAGIIGLSLLGLVYIGMGILGAFHSHDFMNVDAGTLFQLISFSLLGTSGAAIISISVFLACLSTVIGLSAVVAEYTKNIIFSGKINYVQSLCLVLASSIPLSIFGLSYVLAIAGGPIVFVGYPVLITLTLCNIAYKMCNFGYVKTPVAITFLMALASYFFTL